MNRYVLNIVFFALAASAVFGQTVAQPLSPVVRLGAAPVTSGVQDAPEQSATGLPSADTGAAISENNKGDQVAPPDDELKAMAAADKRRAEKAALAAFPNAAQDGAAAAEGSQPEAQPAAGAAEQGTAMNLNQPPEASGAAPLSPSVEFDLLAKNETAKSDTTKSGTAKSATPPGQTPAASAPAAAPVKQADLTSTPTGNVVVNLINKLVEKGVLGPEDAKTMVAQAKAEAETHKQQSEADMYAIAQIAAVQTMTDQAVAEQTGISAVERSRREMESSYNVSYIPAPVRQQLTEDIKRELAAQGLSVPGDGTKPPPGLPTLLARLKPSGEIRMRYEADLYPNNNDATGAFPNFNAINTGPPFDVTGTQFAPQWNTDQNRNRFRLLARFGLGINLDDNFSAGFRLATGENSSPVTVNQSLGLPNGGQGGQFSKYAVWLDRAYIRYDLGGGEDSAKFTFWTGRFDNPFFSTPLIFDNDLGFDGAAIKLAYNYRNIVIPTLVAGAFPVFNTDLNFSSNQPQKYPSYDKYLFGIQAGTEVNITRNWSAQAAAAYYYFYNIEGKLSTPFYAYTQSDQGDTDNSRPSFAQKGNTYRPLRQIIPGPYNDYGAINQWQYFGLATPFHDVALTGQLNYDGFEPVRVSIVAEFVQNLAFNSSQINQVAVNNRGSINTNDPNVDTANYGPFDGSGSAWLVDLQVGHAELDKIGAWQFSCGYRWIGSDAVVDGFNDSDFGLGGTNMKGFTVAARMALSPSVYVGLRWFGSESIAGPQFDMNIFQFDIGAKF